MNTPSFTRIRLDELSNGPLPYCLYDRQGRLLYRKGVVIGSMGVLRLMVARGLYRHSEAAAEPSATPWRPAH
ncbi:MAG: hypothetical protein KDF95_20455 [Rhodocyclaceae bacterium]|nr:hypothetical protein [Rhodocyclaceae bacterium]